MTSQRSSPRRLMSIDSDTARLGQLDSVVLFRKRQPTPMPDRAAVISGKYFEAVSIPFA